MEFGCLSDPLVNQSDTKKKNENIGRKEEGSSCSIRESPKSQKAKKNEKKNVRKIQKRKDKKNFKKAPKRKNEKKKEKTKKKSKKIARKSKCPKFAAASQFEIYSRERIISPTTPTPALKETYKTTKDFLAHQFSLLISSKLFATD